MDLRVASTIYDAGMRPWQNNVNDRVDYQRAFLAGGGEIKRIAQAMLSQNPLTPDSEIRQNMTSYGTPPRFGYHTTQLTALEILRDKLNSDTNIQVNEWNNFSGGQGEINSTIRPNNGVW